MVTAVATAETCVCTRCGQDKDRSLFGLHCTRRTGLQAWCRQCKSIKAGVADPPAPKPEPLTRSQISRRWYETHTEQRRLIDAAYRTINADRLRRRDRENRRIKQAVRYGKERMPDGFALVRTKDRADHRYSPWPLGRPIRPTQEVVCHFQRMYGGWQAITPQTAGNEIKTLVRRLQQWKGIVK